MVMHPILQKFLWY